MTPWLERVKAALAPDGYDVADELASGGMGTVFRADDQKHHRTVAVKVLRPELATGIGVERFLREIHTAAGLTHPHVLPLYDSGESGGLLYYVMPYVEGETLRGRLTRERQLAIDEAVRIASEVAAALAYAHSRGVVHRDIKPENVMFSADHAVVADFGIAWALTAASPERLTASGMVLGTPAYMSPEQATRTGQVDGRSDVYSLGCVLYEMLTGSTPFSGVTAQAVIARHSVDMPQSIRTVRPTVPDALERAVLKALAKVPADRFATVAQFAEALNARGAPAQVDAGGRESIAVLPFTNLTSDPDFEYLSDGIAEEITIALDQLPGLDVAARTSSFAFRGRAVDLAEVGAKLGVASVLEGSVRKAENRLRVTARLVKVANGFPLWSERYDREMTDVFAIQDDIARAIAGRLKVTLGDGQSAALVTRTTDNLDAYHLYLRGRYYLAQRGLGLRRALECFDHALTLDPNYALAHAGLAEACTVLAQYGLVPPAAIGKKAHTAAQRALELAPDLAEAHCASGALSLVCDWDWPGAATGLRRALELSPRSVTARIWLAFYLVFVEGRLDEGIDHARRAVELDPLAPLPATQLGMTLLGAGRSEEAAAALRRAGELAPTMFLPSTHLGLLYADLGRTEEAIALLDLAIVTSGRHPWTLSALAVCYRSLDRLADVEAIHDELAARARREYVQSSMLAISAASLGRMDEAFELLARACDERDGVLVYSRRYPFFRLLQTDPRMQEIYRRVGFPDLPSQRL